MVMERATGRSRKINVEKLADSALNYYPDQSADIGSQLRKLNLVRARKTAQELVSSPYALALLGGAALSLWRGRFVAASLFSAVLLVQQVLGRRNKREAMPVARGRLGTRTEELEVERYALKVQRGDYGKLEVIPFR